MWSLTVTDSRPEPDWLIPSELVRRDASFAELVERFLDGLPERLEQLDTALANNDFDTLCRTAHQLKGSGGGYGYPALTQLAAQIERHALNAQAQACTDALCDMKKLVARMVVGTD
jgi:HPt (histidine-containing phosphotransfer) domain-containing protein